MPHLFRHRSDSIYFIRIYSTLHCVCFRILPKPSQHGLLHRAEDIFISGTAAQMTGQQFADLVIGIFLSGLQKFRCAHDKARGTESALDSGLINKGLLNVGHLAVRSCQALQGQDFPALGPHSQVNTGIEALAVDQDVAGSALSYLTALLDAGKAEIIPQHIG